MKKLLLAIAALVVLATSCKKGDSEPTCGEMLQGTWRATSITLNGAEWFGPTKYISVLEIELSRFSVADTEGEARITFQGNGQPPASPIEGIYKPNNSCSRVTMPDFWADPTDDFSLSIEQLDEETLQLRINYIGSGSPDTDGNLVIDLDKIN